MAAVVAVFAAPLALSAGATASPKRVYLMCVKSNVSLRAVATRLPRDCMTVDEFKPPLPHAAYVYLGHLRWTHWSARGARGVGKNTQCGVGCSTFSVAVRLSRPVRGCGGRTVFSRLELLSRVFDWKTPVLTGCRVPGYSADGRRAHSVRCGRVYVPAIRRRVRVRTVHTREGCGFARGLIEAAFTASVTRHWDTFDPTWGDTWIVRGWFCSLGEGGTQRYCYLSPRHGASRIDGTSRASDGWSGF